MIVVLPFLVLAPAFGLGPDWKTLHVVGKFLDSNPQKPDQTFIFKYAITNGTISNISNEDGSLDVKISGNDSGVFQVQIPRNYPYTNSPTHDGNPEILIMQNGIEMTRQDYKFATADCNFEYSVPFSGNSEIRVLFTYIPEYNTFPYYGDSVSDSCILETIYSDSNSTSVGTLDPDSAKKVNLWSYDPPGSPGPLGVSANGSFAVIGTRQDDQHGSIYLLDNYGTVVWSHALGGFVKSLSVSPDDKFIEAKTIQILNNGGRDYGYNEWNANPTLYLFDNQGHMIYNEGLIPTWRMTSLSSDGSLVASGSGNGILYSDKSGKALWEYDTKNNVTSVSVSPNGLFVAGCTTNDIMSFDKHGLLLWDYHTNNTDSCSGIVSTDLGYVLTGTSLSNVVGSLDIFDNHGNLVWAHVDSYENIHPMISSDKQYEIEISGTSERGYGDMVYFNKLDYGHMVPEFPFAQIMLVFGIISAVVIYRVKK